MKNFVFGIAASFAIVFPFAVAGAYTETVLYSFAGGTDGIAPQAGLTADPSGALYGMTRFGGANSGGTIFKLTPPAAGQTTWTETILFTFTDDADGGDPWGSLTIDGSGALYGTTPGGGSDGGTGTVFKLTPPAAGETAWTKTILYSFKNDADGEAPHGDILVDKTGALYGTTYNGGLSYNGTVFRLTPPPAGQTEWQKTTLYNFSGGSDGGQPSGALIKDSAGSLYGTTSEGGLGQRGTVFKLTPPTSGKTTWTETVLYFFEGKPYGGYPTAGLVADVSGNLYGSTLYEGSDCVRHFKNAGCGTLFRVAPPDPNQGNWVGHLIYKFKGRSDGVYPYAGLIADSKGALYGTTEYGGAGCPTIAYYGCGTIFKLTPTNVKKTSWSESVLYSFRGGSSDGLNPLAGLIMDSTGALYGTTSAGGNSNCEGGCGTVFKLTPEPPRLTPAVAAR